MTAAPWIRMPSAEDSAEPTAVLRSAAVNDASMSPIRRPYSSSAPSTMSSGPACNAVSTSDDSSACSGACAAWPRPDDQMITAGTAMPPSSRQTARITPADGSSTAARITDPVPTRIAEKMGSITRRLRSDIASTSSTIRRNRSPRLNAGRPAGANGMSRSYNVTRRSTNERNAAWWLTSRSA